MIIQSKLLHEIEQLSREDAMIMYKKYQRVPPHAVIAQRRPKQGPKTVTPARRARRNSFWKQIAAVWKARNPNSGGAFSVLAALYSPWENWNGVEITPTPYQMYQIYMARFYHRWIHGDVTILYIDTAFTPWPTDWPAPVGWGIPTIDYNFSPPKIYWPYSAPLNPYRMCGLTVYLASPPTKTTTDPFAASLRTWTNHAPFRARTPTLWTWQFPDNQEVYPYKLPDTQTRCAIRPHDGNYLSLQTGNSYALPFSSTVQRFYLDKPNPA